MKKLLASTSVRITIGVVIVMVIVVVAAYFTSRPLVAQDDAKTIALAEAGVSEDELISMEIVASDSYYTVTFATAERNYSYDIAKDDGDVVRASFNVESDTTLDSGSTTEEDTSTTDEGTSSDATNDDTTSSNSSSSNSSSSSSSTTSSSSSNASSSSSSTITEAKAKSIALADAGVSSSDVSYIWVETDYDHGVKIYEIDFYANGTEYEYDISATDGSIIAKDYEVKNTSPSTSGDIISLEEASTIALARVSGATSSNLKIKLDYDDGRQVYEGEIHYNGKEYEFKIDASSGTVIEWSEE